MRAADDTADPRLHPRYWQAQLEASGRVDLSWGFTAFFVGFGCYYLLALLIGALLPGPGDEGFNPAAPPSLGPLLLLVFVPNLALGAVPVVFSLARGGGPRRDFGLVPTVRDVAVGLACGAAAIVGGFAVALLVTAATKPDEVPRGSLDELTRGAPTVWVAMLVLFVFVGAPLTEELLVRGALWGALEHYRVPRYPVLVLTAMIFAFLHFEPFRFPILFVGGLAIGAARMITGRIGASMVAHAVNNVLPALLILVGVTG